VTYLTAPDQTAKIFQDVLLIYAEHLFNHRRSGIGHIAKSFTMKRALWSSTVQGGGKRRAGIAS
jgi:hypothetical protein